MDSASKHKLHVGASGISTNNLEIRLATNKIKTSFFFGLERIVAFSLLWFCVTRPIVFR